MGEAELNKKTHQLIIRSIFFFYGDAASTDLSIRIADDIQMHWNEPNATVTIRKDVYNVRFETEGIYAPDLNPEKVWYNDDPKLNFFRIEEYANGNISFVDGIGCNTGYFKLDNLRQTSTTAAHEYGHTLGLIHPEVIDIRGTGVPGIMYPRGTICDPQMQYDPTAQPGEYGGFLDPVHRKVLQQDIDDLKLHKLDFSLSHFVKVGEFTSLYHQKHVMTDFG
jgi:hypothetical protein